jgi:4-amino-4-deoxy-L-arabinose transferase-like glycosyltransferase
MLRQTDESPAMAGRAIRLPPRAVQYSIALLIISVPVIFTNLGGPRLEGDEAHYALCVDHILRSGQWLTLSAHPPRPYFAKPPMYMWMTAATYRWLGGFEFKYRFWSASFGVGCVLLTFVLGRMLFSPELGLIAAGLLLTNRQFLLEHGAREGDMDTAVTFCVLLACISYWRAISRPNPGRAISSRGWLLVGLGTGAACLFKPLGGAIALLLLWLHALLFSGRDVRRTIGGIVIALLVGLLIAAPWNVIQWARFHDQFLRSILSDSQGTVWTGRPGETKPALFYLSAITLSSWAFYLFIPATIFAAARAAVSTPARRQYSLLAILIGGWVLLLSLSSGKFVHYVYPVFPMIAIAVTAMLAEVGRLIAQRRHWKPQTTGAIFAIACAILLVACARFAGWIMPHQNKKYAAWEMYKSLAPQIQSHRVRLIFCGLPTQSVESPQIGLKSSDLFYLTHMDEREALTDTRQMDELLRSQQPALLLISKFGAWGEHSVHGRTSGPRSFSHKSYDVLTIDIPDAVLRAGS